MKNLQAFMEHISLCAEKEFKAGVLDTEKRIEDRYPLPSVKRNPISTKGQNKWPT
jgi:hypothetical protein